MAKQVNLYDAKTRLSRLVDEAAAGEEIVIARHGRPVAKLVRVGQPKRRKIPWGLYRDKIWIAPDFDETPQEIIDAFEGKFEGKSE